MKYVRFVTNPAVIMMVLAAFYVALRVDSGQRMHMLALLWLTALGASEVVAVAVLLIRRERSRNLLVAHTCVALGGLLSGFSLIDDLSAVPFTLGMLLMSAGILALGRERQHA